MASGFIQKETLFLLLLLLVAVVAAAARKLRVPYPVLLTIIGGILGLLPIFPNIALEPNLVFYVFLPPLLFAAGWQLSWREFRSNLTRILMLAVGLVLFTIFALIAARKTLLPGFDWQSALLLGAIIGATDAIAATAIARRLGLPRRVVELLEAESLVNDGTGLLAFQFGLTILVSGRAPSPFEGFGKLFFLTFGGILIGLFVGFAVSKLEQWIDDGPIEIVVSIITCYAVYLLADHMHTSGVLAVIACSMLMSRESHNFMSPQVRLQSAVVWDALTFVLNGIVFILIGLQLPFVLGELSHVGIATLLKDGILFCGTVLILRLVWIFATTYGVYWRGRWAGPADNPPSNPSPNPKEMVVLTWGGMRGVLSLAAAFSVPYATASGTFPQRSMIVYLTFCLIGSSLVLQGLSMPWLISFLGIAGSNEEEREELKARRILAEAAVQHLNRRRLRDRFDPGIVRELHAAYERRMQELPTEWTEPEQTFSRKQRDDLILEVLGIERAMLLQLRDEGVVGDHVLRTIQQDLDIFESRIHSGGTENALRQHF